MSLLHWASPILVDGMMQGALIAGPSLVIEPDEFLHDTISGIAGISSSDIEELRVLLSQIPFISTEKATSLSQLLFMTSYYLSTVEGSSTETSQEQVEQQSRIGEYIQYIKTMGEALTQISAIPSKRRGSCSVSSPRETRSVLSGS